MKYLLSICIPVYNTQEYLVRCLDSLEISKNNLIEFIIVNDGSTDHSVQIINKYKNNKNVVFINKKNAGHGKAMQDAISVANGKYFRMLDSDDWYETSDFEKFINLLTKIEDDCVLTNYRTHVIDNFTSTFGNNKSEIKNILLPKCDYNKSYDLSKIDIDINSNIFLLPTITIKTEILKKLNLQFPEKISLTDNLYTFCPIVKIKNITFLNCCVYIYYIGRSEQSCNINNMKKNIKSKLIISNQMFLFLKGYEKNKFYPFILSKIYSFSNWVIKDICELNSKDNNIINDIKKLIVNKKIFATQFRYLIFKIMLFNIFFRKVFLLCFKILNFFKKI